MIYDKKNRTFDVIRYKRNKILFKSPTARLITCSKTHFIKVYKYQMSTHEKSYI